ncbi:hypothetical protein F5J12DRAFT_192196 [Pisolithus orientalis]|uniref:uncharacterized protein n=1 Tax=Pisolithus orientalis TaxID=936130 RepID=UPI0022251B4D|nr:uncharacterized protein F5J12DRAFT_192196 [Pisolithus orientalis]KAI6032958.1 hypothetical protein F5J12DRAFT_192196 [Pisolithus orientalis]
MSFIASTRAVFTRIFTALANFVKICLKPFVQARSLSREIGGLDDGTFELASSGPRPQEDRVENRTSQLQYQWESVMPKAVCIWGCDCEFCRLRPVNVSGNTGAHTVYIPTDHSPRPPQHYRLPSLRCVMDTLYPPSLLTVPTVLPNFATYIPEDPLHFPAACENRCPAPSHVSGGSLGDVYPLRSGGRGPTVWAELGDGDRTDDSFPPPPYSRFDAARPRCYEVPDTLSRYPHISFLNSLAS